MSYNKMLNPLILVNLKAWGLVCAGLGAVGQLRPIWRKMKIF